jgi:hypothetical protein
MSSPGRLYIVYHILYVLKKGWYNQPWRELLVFCNGVHCVNYCENVYTLDLHTSGILFSNVFSSDIMLLSDVILLCTKTSTVISTVQINFLNRGLSASLLMIQGFTHMFYAIGLVLRNGVFDSYEPSF